MRHEFSKPTKREALKRSGGLCEAIGEVYGLEPGQRCDAPLGYGVEFDHYPVPATEKGSDTLDNCVSACPACHKIKTRTFDIPVQAKVKRVRDKDLGITSPKRKLQGPGFRKPPGQHSATRPIQRKGDRA